MSGNEHFSLSDPENILAAIPEVTTGNELRRANKIEGDLALGLLEHEFACKGLQDHPRFFRSTDVQNDPLGKQSVLVVPQRFSHHSPGYFVAINRVRSHPHLFDYEQLTTTAFKFVPTMGHVEQFPESTSERHKAEPSWPVRDDRFGPFLFEDSGALYVMHWEADRLEIPATHPPRLSFEYIERNDRARRLLKILQGIRAVDEVEDLRLIAYEL